jgi:hypothetical protein
VMQEQLGAAVLKMPSSSHHGGKLRGLLLPDACGPMGSWSSAIDQYALVDCPADNLTIRRFITDNDEAVQRDFEVGER